MNDFLASYRQTLNLEKPQIGEHDASTFNKIIDILIEQHIPICSFTFGIPEKNDPLFESSRYSMN